MGYIIAPKASQYAEFHLTTTPEVVNIDADGITYVKIPNMVLSVGNGFSVSLGTLKKENSSGLFLINGVSDLEVNKAVNISYALFVNNSIVPSEITPHTFTNQSKIENISITSIATININDEIEVRAKGDGTTGVILTIAKLDVTFVSLK